MKNIFVIIVKHAKFRLSRFDRIECKNNFQLWTGIFVTSKKYFIVTLCHKYGKLFHFQLLKIGDLVSILKKLKPRLDHVYFCKPKGSATNKIFSLVRCHSNKTWHTYFVHNFLRVGENQCSIPIIWAQLTTVIFVFDS